MGEGEDGVMNHWNYVALGDICTVERGGSPRPIDDFITTESDGINWIKIGDTDESMYITKTAQKIKPEGMKKSRYVKPGDFLLSNSMSFGRPYILKIDGCIHDGWLVLRDENNVFDKKFLYYYLSAPITYEKFKSMAVGGVVNNLNSDMVRKIRVPLPSKQEQRDIADSLDKITNLHFLRKQQLVKLDELVKARFVEMFDAISPKKCASKIGECAEVLGGYAFKSDCFSNQGVPVVRIGNINDGRIDIDYNTCYAEEFWNKNPRFQARKYDILMAMSGATTGKVGIYKSDERLLINQRVACIRARDDESAIFLFACLQLPWMYNLVQEASAGCAQPNISGKQIETMPVPKPETSKVHQFAAFVERVDQQKQTIQQSLEKLELMKKALMQEYFE